MYKVDIPEKEIKDLLLAPGIDIDVLAESVLKREFLKILLREKYSS